MLRKLLSTIPDEYEKIVIDDEDLLLAAKRNKGARQATGEFLLFIDDDNYLAPGAIQAMVRRFDDHIGVMGMVACYDDKPDLIADGGSFRFYTTGFTWGRFTNQMVAGLKYRYWVDEVANAFMVRRGLFEQAEGFDEYNFPIDLDEADLCKRIKNLGYCITMNPHAVCYHKSQTYSHIPNFRRPMNAYFLARNLVLYQRKHLDALSFGVFVLIFLPIRTCFYTASLLWRRKLQMIPHFLKGELDGLLGRRTNQYQKG